MGASLMRTLFLTALVLLAAVGLHSAESISFDDLYKAADSYDHPTVAKAAPAPKPQDPEMKEWSTEHLLGFDEPVPEHMFDDLQAPQKKQHTDHMRTATKKPERKRGLATPASMDAKKAAVVHHEALKEAKLVEEEKLVAAKKHKATMKARTSHKKAAKASRKKIHMVNPHDILNQIHEDPEQKSADDLADMLIGTENVEPGQTAEKAAQKKAPGTKVPKKAATKTAFIKARTEAPKKTEIPKKTEVPKKIAKKVAESNQDGQLMGAKLPQAMHHHANQQTTKKPAHDKDELLSLPHIMDDDDEQPELATEQQHPVPAATLQGMASKLLEASEQKDHVSATKKEEEREKERKEEEMASNGHVVHLDLSADDTQAVSNAPKAEDDENLSDLLSVDDDDDDYA